MAALVDHATSCRRRKAPKPTVTVEEVPQLNRQKYASSARLKWVGVRFSIGSIGAETRTDIRVSPKLDALNPLSGGIYETAEPS